MHEKWLNRRTHNEGVIRTFGEPVDPDDTEPEFWVSDIDEAYREGFEEGFDYCVECFERMYRKKGFVRVREIVNILWDWSERVLRPWRYFGEGKHKNDKDHHPRHVHESWNDIRRRIISRDRACVRCNGVLDLEVDHITEVQDGGRPEDDNLQTLCKCCHKTKQRH